MPPLANHLPPAQSNPVSAPAKSTLTVRIEPDGRTMRFDGRNAWMLRKLIDAGKKGITTADLPAGVRVSHFVLCLRKRGIIISSDRVSHGGPFAGIHSVYRCEMDLTVLEEAGLAA